MAKYTIGRALVDYLSQQPDHTAKAGDCFRAVDRLTGSKHARPAVRRERVQLGIQLRYETVKGQSGGLVVWWTLPDDLDGNVTSADWQVARRLVETVANADPSEFSAALDAAMEQRSEQVLTALAKMAANGRVAGQ